MKKAVKFLLSSMLVLTTALLPSFGCARASYEIKQPLSSVSEETVGGSADEIGLSAGFAVKYNAGLVDNESGENVVYDDRYYYFNQVRSTGADPGAWYVSYEDAMDSYEKLLAKEKEKKSSSFSQADFDKEYGTKEYWEQTYADKFYMVTTGGGSTNLSVGTKQKYPTALYGLFTLRTSDDLSDWTVAGEIDGYAVMAEADSWINSVSKNSWAPELSRDPISGLYILCGSTNSKSGDETTEYNPATEEFDTLYNQWDSINMLMAISPTPVGPYRFITADEYYSHLASFNEDGSVKTVTVGEGEEAKEMAIYRDDLLDDLGNGYKNGDTVYLTEYKDGEFLNGNGESVRKNSLPLNFAYYCEKIIEAYPHWYIENRGIWPCIDINPIVDSKGDIYIYFSQHSSSVMTGIQIWVVKMQDWITPLWDTLTHVASPSYYTIYSDGVNASALEYLVHEKLSDGSYKTTKELRSFAINGVFSGQCENEKTVNEGTFVVEKDGWYYLTYSPFGYYNKEYSIYMAISNNPYGPFVKMHEFSPVIGIDKQDDSDYVAGTGHHSFVWAGDELYAVYHCYLNPTNNVNESGSFLGRGIAIDKVDFYDYDGVTFADIVEERIATDGVATGLGEEWVRDRFIDCNNSDYFGSDSNEIKKYNDAVPIMYGNGPTYSLQPLPEVVLPNGYKNVARDAQVEIVYGDEDSAVYTNDGMFTYQKWSEDYEVTGNASMGQLKIKLKWENPVDIRNIMIYNSRNYEYAFTQVKSVVFKLAQKPLWYPANGAYNGYAYINDLKADPQGWNSSNFTMRKGGSAMATFNEMSVSEIIITVSASDKIDPTLGRNIVKLSEVYVMGKPSANEG
ncbi:MAG: family 43 glycosylhydrolase [Clostridia bacterium]|nr:family 43 glycosylhydrolase [Clostridia bacterium]